MNLKTIIKQTVFCDVQIYVGDEAPHKHHEKIESTKTFAGLFKMIKRLEIDGYFERDSFYMAIVCTHFNKSITWSNYKKYQHMANEIIAKYLSPREIDMMMGFDS